MSSAQDAHSIEPLITELLRKANLLNEKDLPRVYELKVKHNESIEAALVRSELVSEDQIAQAYAEHLMIPVWTPGVQTPSSAESSALADLLPERLCRENAIAPVERQQGTLIAAAVNPTDLTLIEGLQLIAGTRVEVQVGRLSHVVEALDRLYGARDVVREMAAEVAAEGQRPMDADEQDLVLDLEKPIANASKEGQIVALVSHVLKEAVIRRASDIHLEPYEESVRARLRVDGELLELTPPPRSMFVPMISRLKILSRMDIAEKRIPQDGSFTMQLEGKKIDLRVSTVPSVWGEKMVLRLLNKSAIPLEMEKLGFSEKQSNDFKTAINSPHGLVFVTGPTGSGKSTTLYTALNILNTPDRNIVTVEDPVEYRFTGINQIHVRPQVNLTFATALRAFLRQDPDVIMVGEVRDRETAEICLRAALTGHLVLSTLHTNDAVSAVNRLVDMEIEPFLLSATLRLVQAQRLIRKLCPACKKPIPIAPRTAETLKIAPGEVMHGPGGCDACGGTGYRGRIGIFEVIPMSTRLRDLIQAQATVKELYAAAKAEGVQFLLDSGMAHARAGKTSVEEVLTVALAGEE
jgi:type II secretory ATPase GspE/PulE/Tfp pilus assembly ATPase PilB-like protein